MTLRERFIFAFKLGVIILLVMLIGLASVMLWKGDTILREVTGRIEAELRDTMVYTDASVNFFRHFPAASVRFDSLTLGDPEHPILRKGNIDLVLPLIPILRGEIVLKRVVVADGSLDVSRHGSQWTYDLFKPRPEEEKESGRSTRIRQLILTNCDVRYDDGEGYGVTAHIDDATIKGEIEADLIALSFDSEGTCHTLSAGNHEIAPGTAFNLTGEYAYDGQQARHELREIALANPGIQLMAEGSFNTSGEYTLADLHVDLSESRIDSLLKWLPASARKSIDQLKISGNLEGEYTLKGPLSERKPPHQHILLTLKKGMLASKGIGEPVNDLTAELRYDADNPDPSESPMLRLKIGRKGLIGGGMSIEAVIDDPKRRLLTLKADGAVPAQLLNLAGNAQLAVNQGTLLFDDFLIEGYATTRKPGLHETLSLLNGELGVEDIRCTFAGKSIDIAKGRITKEDTHQASFDIEGMTWHKAEFKNVKADITSVPDQLSFDLAADLCDGQVVTAGSMTWQGESPVFEADWKALGVEIRKVLLSFDEFGQQFITSANLSGKADIHAHMRIPMDKQWKIRPKAITVAGAVDVSDGRLQGLKTLEDFSDYIHLADLRDIKFSRLRNYIRIADGQILLPVMFVQSSAINLSLSGWHTFDQRIEYNIKINAGQTLGQRVKKKDGVQVLVPARKSGWINMYFRLIGSVSEVRYLQDRKGVLAGFESSTLLKESLRNELVDRFGYDLYWLEPNEWEDIPEYR